MNKEQKRIIIKEEDYDIKKQTEWEKSIILIKYEHDFEKKIYTIDYKEKE